MTRKFQKELFERLTRLETMMTNHLDHHEKTEKKFYRLWLPIMILGINLAVLLLPKIIAAIVI